MNKITLDTGKLKDLAWKIIAWIAIALLSFIGFASVNTYEGAKDGKIARQENKTQQSQIDSLCNNQFVYSVYQKLYDEQMKEVRDDIKSIKDMVFKIYSDK